MTTSSFPPAPQLTQALGQPMADKRIGILRQIGALGSISQAARAAGVSYKAAWQAIDTLTNLAGTALVERVVGGAGGGGARLTPAGHALLQAAQALQQARSEVLERMQSPQQAAAARLQLRTSMRNQWPCVVHSVQALGPIVRVHLRAAEGALVLVARITRESAELLGLQPGQPLLALCKATAVRVQRGGAPAGAGEAANHWPGQAQRVARGPSGDEVATRLDAGLQVVGFAPPGSALRARSRVRVVVDEAAVVLAAVEGDCYQ